MAQDRLVAVTGANGYIVMLPESYWNVASELGLGFDCPTRKSGFNICRRCPLRKAAHSRCWLRMFLIRVT